MAAGPKGAEREPVSVREEGRGVESRKEEERLRVVTVLVGERGEVKGEGGPRASEAAVNRSRGKGTGEKPSRLEDERE